MGEMILVASYGSRRGGGSRTEQGRETGLVLLEKELAAQTGLPVVQAYFNKALVAESPDKSLEYQMGLVKEFAPETLTILPTFLTPGKSWMEFRRQILAHCNRRSRQNYLNYANYRNDLNHWDRFQMKNLNVLPTLLESGSGRDALTKLLPEVYHLKTQNRYLFVGHGAGDGTDALYLDVERRLRRRGYENVRFALLHGQPSVRHLLKTWEADETEPRTVTVIPFLISPGTHMMRDIMGEEPGSIADTLRSANYKPTVIPVGLLEFPEIRRLYIREIVRCSSGATALS